MKLTQELLKKIIEYNLETGVMRWVVNRNSRARKGGICGAIQKCKHTSYRRICINGKSYYAHRLAVLYVTGKMPLFEVDHDDGDGLNNKWGNLCSCTSKENNQNRAISCTSTSGHQGVYYLKGTGKWRARIGIDGKRINLGCFSSPKEAGDAYLKAKKNVHKFNPVPREMM